MPRSFIRQIVEIAGVDHFEVRQIGYLIKLASSRDHGGGGFRTNIQVGEKPEMFRTGSFYGAHARHRRKPVAKPLPLGLDHSREATAPHLTPEVGTGAVRQN